jgi:alkanesulfonate monooxygenase SsuD/methylene tetrahydromethanopterin reductase-like flavin-dependent oxidoreductase (luciferase family)
MKFGIVFPFGDAPNAVATAEMAEAAGWDGFFVWEPVWGVDPWVTLGAVAVRTERIRLGTMLTPVSRRRPWKLAGETATLDHLSNGRATISVGLGALDTGFAEFGEETDRKTRAALLDEGLDIIDGLWAGQPFNYEGVHYQVRETAFHVPPPPVQQPRIPIWVVGAWPRMKSMRRAMRWDGLLPAKMSARGKFETLTPDDIGEMAAFVAENRTAQTPYDIVVEGATPGDDPEAAAASVLPWAEAGATWWIEALWSAADVSTVQTRVQQGPPRQQTVL